MAKGRMFKEPVGKSKYSWNNLCMGTIRAVVCELCGTEWPALPPNGDESYHLMSFLGLQTIEECCGKAADILYEEFGEVFARQFLYDFAENPTGPRFGVLLIVLETALKRAGEKGRETTEKTQELHQSLRSVTKTE
jgi:hypothetical protein